MDEGPKISKADAKAAADALAKRVAIGQQRAAMFVAATQGSSKDGKPGCQPRYPMTRA